jgi:hypothetical protein
MINKRRSDGIQPHTANVEFSRKTRISVRSILFEDADKLVDLSLFGLQTRRIVHAE